MAAWVVAIDMIADAESKGWEGLGALAGGVVSGVGECSCGGVKRQGGVCGDATPLGLGIFLGGDPG